MDAQVKRLENINHRLTAVANYLESDKKKSSVAHPDTNHNNVMSLPILRDYETIINDSFATFAKLSRQIGGELPSMIDHVTRLFDAQKVFIQKAVQTRKPTNAQQISELVKPQLTEIEAINAITSKNRKSPLFNHLSSISEGIPAFGWILISPTPAPHIKDMSDASQFYANRVLKEFKDKDPSHCDWVKQWLKILNELHAYVKQYHTTGLTWGTAATSAAAPPPPPPPPPPPMPTNSFSQMNIDDGAARNGLMNSINALGAQATSNLKKVPDELKAHKNPQLREQPLEKAEKSHVINPTKPSSAPSAPPKLALEGNKWVVEYHSNRTDLKITEPNMKHTVYIYKCSNCTITIPGKVNSIVLDQCTKVGLQFTAVVSLVEFINCRSMKAQALEHVPTIQIEKTDGCHIFLPQGSLNTEFITSKSSEMTINVPIGDGEYKEYPIPEQFKTRLQNGKQLSTVPNESSGV